MIQLGRTPKAVFSINLNKIMILFIIHSCIASFNGANDRFT